MGEDISGPPARVYGTQMAAALFAPRLAGRTTERLGIAYLDGQLALLRLSVVPGDRRSGITLPLRMIIHDALTLGAQAMVVAHNHPDGTVKPSPADRHATSRLVDVARPLGIRLLDHLIFAGREVVSFRALGLL